MNAITPLSVTEDTVTLSRADFDALMEEIEDARDVAAALAAEAEVAAGRSEAVPMDLAERLWAGENPVRVWRDHRGLTGSELAKRAGVSQSYLSEIETGRKPGSFDAMTKLARALGVSLDELVSVGESEGREDDAGPDESGAI